MVLDADRQATLLRVQGRSSRHGPGHQHAGDLETEVVVQPGRPMTLDDEAARLGLRGLPIATRGRVVAGRLRRLGEVALAAVLAKGHALGPTIYSIRNAAG